MNHNGTERNWRVVGLTPDNRVILADDAGTERETEERPSEFVGVSYLTRAERGILRRGVTPTGRDRSAPK